MREVVEKKVLSENDRLAAKLRQRYLDDREHVARWIEKMGPQHLAVINLQQEMKEIDKSIVDELQRIAQTYKSDYEIAKAREDSLRTSLGKQVREVGTSGRAHVDLKELPVLETPQDRRAMDGVGMEHVLPQLIGLTQQRR